MSRLAYGLDRSEHVEARATSARMTERARRNAMARTMLAEQAARRTYWRLVAVGALASFGITAAIAALV